MQVLTRFLSRPINSAPVALFRIAFGLFMVVESIRFMGLGWLEKYYLEPVHHFTYFGFGWVQPLPSPLLYAAFTLYGIAALFVALGLYYRLAAVILFIFYSYSWLLEQTIYNNHYYLLSLIAFLLILMPANRRWSLDVKYGRVESATHLPAWSLWLLQFQVGVPYFFGGIAKLNPDWLAGEPMRIWLRNRANSHFMGSYFTEEWFVYLVSYSGLLLDLLIVPALLWKRTRILALVAGTFFHIMNMTLFQIGIFPYFMLFATPILFLDPDLWGKQKNRLQRKKASAAAVASPMAKWITIFLAFWVVTQCLIPLRHYLYPGNSNWTEEGHRFAWHMKLRDKQSRGVTFTVSNPDTGKSITVDPYDRSQTFPVNLLSYRQHRKLNGRPYLIHQFATQYLAKQPSLKKWSKVKITVDATCSLNGRPAQRLIDPDLDLLSVKWGLAPSKWIEPLKHPLKKPKRAEP